MITSISNQPHPPIPPPEEGVEDFAQILLAIRSTPSVSNEIENQMVPPELVVSSLKDNQPFTTDLIDPDYSEGDSTQAENMASDDEDYEIFENDSDEEWFEPNIEKMSGTERRMEGEHEIPSPPLHHRPKRKKAPSGSACEKHKRWKKRCPDDCPMRKARFRHGPSKNAEKKKSRKSAKTQPSIPIKDEESKPNLRNRHVESCEESLAAEEGRDKPSGLTQRDPESIQEESIIRQEAEASPPEDEKDSIDACNKHTHLGLRCPPTCPKKPHKGNLAPSSPISVSQTEMSQEMSSLAHPESQPGKGEEKEEAAGIFTRRHSVKRSFPQMDLQSQRTKRLKYLPRSCERHKLLHAKCGADCPDRIQRDQQERKVSDKNYEKVHWRKKLVQFPFGIQSAT